MRHLAMILLSCLSMPLLAEEGHWYRVVVDERHQGTNGHYTYYGKSSLNREEMIACVAGKRPVVLTNLTIWDKALVIEWKEQDRTIDGSVIIAGDRVIAVMPLMGDPRTRGNAPPP